MSLFANVCQPMQHQVRFSQLFQQGPDRDCRQEFVVFLKPRVTSREGGGKGGGGGGNLSIHQELYFDNRESFMCCATGRKNKKE